MSALFSFDPAGRSVVPSDDQARAVAGEPPPQPVQPLEAPPPGRLSVIAGVTPDEPPVAPEEPDELTEYLAATDTRAILADEAFDDSDDEPTGPIPVSGRRNRRGDRRRQHGNGRPAEEATGERLRLTDIASRVELDVDLDPQPDHPASAHRPEPPAPTTAHAARPVAGGRPRRPSVPSWDEIMFGRRRKPD
ncbi:MAG: hypothetical protein ICV70_06380 [Jiangellaceae bacterium]|nr:hypothetical protein [Jiangellaceae bacterium]